MRRDYFIPLYPTMRAYCHIHTVLAFQGRLSKSLVRIYTKWREFQNRSVLFD